MMRQRPNSNDPLSSTLRTMLCSLASNQGDLHDLRLCEKDVVVLPSCFCRKTGVTLGHLFNGHDR